MQTQLQNTYPKYAEQLPGQPLSWLHALRDAAFNEFMQQGIPNIR